MALYDERRDPVDRTEPARAPLWAGNLIPILLAGAVALFVIAMMLPPSTPDRVGDTNAGPSVQTVTPAPSPTIEPRPTQAPQP